MTKVVKSSSPTPKKLQSPTVSPLDARSAARAASKDRRTKFLNSEPPTTRSWSPAPSSSEALSTTVDRGSQGEIGDGQLLGSGRKSVIVLRSSAADKGITVGDDLLKRAPRLSSSPYGPLESHAAMKAGPAMKVSPTMTVVPAMTVGLAKTIGPAMTTGPAMVYPASTPAVEGSAEPAGWTDRRAAERRYPRTTPPISPSAGMVFQFDIPA